MVKFIFMMILISVMMISWQSLQMFYYNFLFLMSLMMVGMFMFKDMSLWESLSVGFGLNYYSIYLIILSMWIIGLMFMSLDYSVSDKVNRQMFMFLLLLMVLVLFFLSMDLMLFYLMFDISMILTFLLIVYWGFNPERLGWELHII